MLGWTEAGGVSVARCATKNSLIHQSRSQAIGQFVGSEKYADCTHLLMVDDDMVPPSDALLRLLALNEPIAAGLCTTRTPPITLTLFVVDAESGILPASHERIPVDTVIKGPFATGAAFILMDRATAGRVIEDHLGAHDWVRENAAQHGRMFVKKAAIEAERLRMEMKRRLLWGMNFHNRVFRFATDDHERQYGEDTSFFWTLFHLGYRPVIDTGLLIGHVGNDGTVWTADDVEGYRK